jgi:hypothetical protein
MGILEILKILAAAATILTGLYSLVRPRAVQGFTGLALPGPRGVTEVRAVLGGAFIGIGAAPLLFHALNGAAAAHVVYQALGIMYLAIAATRVLGMILDKSWVQSNYVSLATEVVMGVVLVL